MCTVILCGSHKNIDCWIYSSPQRNCCHLLSTHWAVETVDLWVGWMKKMVSILLKCETSCVMSPLHPCNAGTLSTQFSCQPPRGSQQTCVILPYKSPIPLTWDPCCAVPVREFCLYVVWVLQHLPLSLVMELQSVRDWHLAFGNCSIHKLTSNYWKPCTCSCRKCNSGCKAWGPL